MGKKKEEWKKILREAGLRSTAPRVAVLQLLCTSGRPLSHGEVLETLGHDDWDQATLYRNLLKLEEAKLIRVASRAGGITHYEYIQPGEETHHHPHFVCGDCGQVSCLPCDQVSLKVDEKWRTLLAESELQFVGICTHCREERPHEDLEEVEG